MKQFLDTNIFAEFIGQRNQFEAVSQIVDAILDGGTFGLHFGWEHLYAGIYL